jgi:hypothetical protein
LSSATKRLRAPTRAPAAYCARPFHTTFKRIKF